jgi:hypothetical protein
VGRGRWEIARPVRAVAEAAEDRRNRRGPRKLGSVRHHRLLDFRRHRSVRPLLRLLPRMSGGEAGIGIGMQNAGLGNPPV